MCLQGEIKKGADPTTERATFAELLRLTQRELFDRCKEIFHTSFKTRKAGKEALNPIRDGKIAFRRRNSERMHFGVRGGSRICSKGFW